MEAIFHEQQDGSLCAQHCLNSLLQGQFYSAVDLADLATELDTMEKLRMAEVGEDTPEYRQFLEQPSTNMDDSGFFSVQVLTRALSVWGLDLLPLNSSNTVAVRAKNSPISANAYICNFREHWFTVRRLGSQWFNLNSLLEGPELVSNTYLGEFLAQLQHEGYDIFLVTGDLPPCDADLVLQAVPATQLVPPKLLSDVSSSGNKSKQGRQRQTGASGSATGGQRSAQTDEDADLEAAMLLSLAETSGSDGGPANIDNEELARVMEMQRQGGWGPEADAGGDEDMEMAIRMSQADQGQHTSEEDEIQRAIALSLEGGAGAVLPGSGGSGRQDGGWGSRLRQQEMEEEQRYKVEQEKASRLEQEELEKALAMSMETDDSPVTTETKPKPKVEVDPVNTAWPKVKNPGPGTLAASGSGSSSKVSQDQSKSKPSALAASSTKTSAPTPSPSKAPNTPQSALSSLSSSMSPSAAAIIMPEGPGHRLGGEAASRGGRGSAPASRPGTSSSAAQPRTDDPEEIRRRRMAFLDKLQKSPPSQ